MDLHVDEHGDLVLDGGSPGTVAEIDEFEQRLMLFLQAYMFSEIGATEKDRNIVAKLELQARKVAQRSSLVDNVHDFTAVKNGPRSVRLYIDYDTNKERLGELLIGPGGFSQGLSGVGEVFR